MKNKTLKLGLVTTVALTALLSFALTASAARMNISRQLCSLYTFPYNPAASALFGNAAVPYVKKIADNICKIHLTIPSSTPFTVQPYSPNQQNRYVVDSNDIPLQAGAADKKVPNAEHIHSSFNDSLEDAFYYEHFIAKFAIDFGPDLKQNIDTNNIICNTPYPNPAPSGTPSKATVNSSLGDCSGYLANLWGGTKVTKTSNGVIWEFGIDNEFPRIFGQNPSLDPLIGGGFDSTNEDNRKFRASVTLPTLNVNSPTNAWSATTTSRVLLRDFAIKKTTNMAKLTSFCSAAGDYDNGWCSLPPLAGYQTETLYGKPYYWFPIGTVSTVWKKPTPPPPSAACESLNLKITQGSNIYNQNNVAGLQPNSPMTVEIVNLTYNPANPQIPPDLKWRYTANLNNQTEGTFKDESNSGISANPYVENDDADLDAFYSGGAGGTIVRVAALDTNNNEVSAPGCKKQFTIPEVPQPKACTNLTILNNGLPFSGQHQLSETVGPLSVQVSTTPGSYVDELDFNWSVTAGPGSLNPLTTTTPPQTTVLSGKGNGTTVTVTAADVVGGVDGDLTQCTGSFNLVEQPQQPMCLALNPKANGVSMPNSFTVTAGSTTTLSGDPKNTLSPHPSAITWSENGPGYYSLGPVSITQNINFPGLCPTPVDNQTFTAPAICDYIYHADANGNGTASYEASPNTGNVANCRANINISPPGQKAQCIELILQPGSLEDDGTTNLKATPVFDDGGSYVTTLRWTGADGAFSNSATQKDETKLSPPPFTELFTQSGGSPEVSAQVIAVPDPNAEIGVCLNKLKKIKLEKLCEDISPSTNANGDICLNVSGGYNGTFTWEISGQADAQTNSPHCQSISQNVPFSVFATGEPTNTACQLDYECEEITTSRTGNQVCVVVTEGRYDGPYTWIVEGNLLSDKDKCATIPEEVSYTVFADHFPQICRFEGKPELPELFKAARKGPEGAYSTDVLTVQPTHDYIYYQIRFVPVERQTTSATITDTISKGYLLAELLPQGDVEPGRINYDTNFGKSGMIVREKGLEIGRCSDLPDGAAIEHCYNGNIGSVSGLELVRVTDEVTIAYRGRVVSSLTNQVCADNSLNICQEKNDNRSRATNVQVHIDEETTIPRDNVQSNNITVQIFCQYILTRAAGDIFLENDLTSGVDIKKCSQFRSTTGIIITPGEEEVPELIKTGAGSQIFTVGHEVCTAGQAGTIENDLAKLYGKDITGLSSQICEVKLRPGSPWKQTVVTNTIDENRTRVSRWGADPALPKDLSAALQFNPDQDVFHYEGDVTSGAINYWDKGAKTVIIENGDLYINGDIKYMGCETGPGTCTVRDIGSLAFIVLNGNVYVDKDVHEISGVFFVQEGDRADSGRLFSNEYDSSSRKAEVLSNVQLVVYGSVYGDIDPLFKNRFFTGDPLKEEGGIVIRFDQRVILNTPPGLREILNLSQTEVAR